MLPKQNAPYGTASGWPLRPRVVIACALTASLTLAPVLASGSSATAQGENTAAQQQAAHSASPAAAEATPTTNTEELALTAEADGIGFGVVAPAGAIATGATLKVTRVTEEEPLAQAQAALAAAHSEEEPQPDTRQQTFVYEVTLVDAAGATVTPTLVGGVTLTLTVDATALLERIAREAGVDVADVTASNVALYQLTPDSDKAQRRELSEEDGKLAAQLEKCATIAFEVSLPVPQSQQEQSEKTEEPAEKPAEEAAATGEGGEHGADASSEQQPTDEAAPSAEATTALTGEEQRVEGTDTPSHDETLVPHEEGTLTATTPTLVEELGTGVAEPTVQDALAAPAATATSANAATSEELAAQEAPAVEGQSLTYTGAPQPLGTVTPGTGASAEEGAVTYRLHGSTAAYATEPPVATDAGTYTVDVRIAGDETHADYTGTYTVTIAKASPSLVLAMDGTTVAYPYAANVKVSCSAAAGEAVATATCTAQSAQAPVAGEADAPSAEAASNAPALLGTETAAASTLAATTTPAAPTVTLAEATEAANQTRTQTITVTPAQTGEVTLTVSVPESANCLGATAELTFTVAAGTIVVADPSTTLTYDGASHGAPAISPAAASCAVSYGTSKDAVTLATPPAYTNAGTYTVYYTATAPNYASATGSYTLTIAPKVESGPLNSSAYAVEFGEVYTEHETAYPWVTVADKNILTDGAPTMLVEGTDYTITFGTDELEAAAKERQVAEKAKQAADKTSTDKAATTAAPTAADKTSATSTSETATAAVAQPEPVTTGGFGCAIITFTGNRTGTLVYTYTPCEYAFITGENETWWTGRDTGIIFGATGNHKKCRKIRVDGATVDPSNYVITAGSTYVQLDADYMRSLELGTHTFEMVFPDGLVSTTFTITSNSG